jgi:transposase
VQGAHCILKEKAPDTDLKRWGTKLAARGGKNAKKRAIVAVVTTGETAWSILSWIRRPVRLRQWPELAVLLHHLWATGEVYEPLRNNGMTEKKAA